ncbi:hypothetical protein AZE42_11703 [Rhizopogon vesiculosus]|uniref:Uncharacterized protein n=1 Tax=Rhizopogon vesiculosus TaxID=180088 RepID=A0A1J8Q488_9AGAM|nr:hypothetical protein AZE42_11703 [Rhizopogon vesiculosus]
MGHANDRILSWRHLSRIAPVETFALDSYQSSIDAAAQCKRSGRDDTDIYSRSCFGHGCRCVTITLGVRDPVCTPKSYQGSAMPTSWAGKTAALAAFKLPSELTLHLDNGPLPYYQLCLLVTVQIANLPRNILKSEAGEAHQEKQNTDQALTPVDEPRQVAFQRTSVKIRIPAQPKLPLQLRQVSFQRSSLKIRLPARPKQPLAMEVASLITYDLAARNRTHRELPLSLDGRK